MAQVTVVDHPILQHSLTVLRRRETPTRLFREELTRASLLLAAEALRHVRVARVRIDTPLEEAEGVALDEDVVLVPILRAGLSMVDAFITLVPDARVGHIGLYRDEESHHPVDYYRRLPENLSAAYVLLLDPMLATGRSFARAIGRLHAEGAARILVVCLVATPEGVEHLAKEHAGVPIIAGALDRGLDRNAFIRPGLGDAGDRSFGTV